jgi:hypothetical protein
MRLPPSLVHLLPLLSLLLLPSASFAPLRPRLAARGFRAGVDGAGEPPPFDTAARPQVLFVDRLAEELDLSPAQVSTIVSRAPRYATSPVCNTADPAMSFLRKRLGLSSKELAKLVVTAPKVLRKSPEENLEPKLVWLRERLGMSEEQTCKMVMREPHIFKYSIKENLEPTLSFLESRLQLSPDQLRVFVLRQPQMLGANTEGMKERLQFAQGRFELSDEEVLRFVERLPVLLVMHVENNLAPTIAFFEDALGKELARDFLVNDSPVTLARGLTRLKARKALVDALGLHVDKSLASK